MRTNTCAGCGEPWPCSDSQRKDISADNRARHFVMEGGMKPTWQTLNALSHHFAYDSENARALSRAAQEHKRMLEFVRLVAIGDAGELGAQVLLKQIEQPQQLDDGFEAALEAAAHLAEKLKRAREQRAELLAALEAFLRAPSIGSSGPGSISIEVQTFNLDAARAALAKAKA